MAELKIALSVLSIVCAAVSMVYARKARRTADQVLEDAEGMREEVKV